MNNTPSVLQVQTVDVGITIDQIRVYLESSPEKLTYVLEDCRKAIEACPTGPKTPEYWGLLMVCNAAKDQHAIKRIQEYLNRLPSALELVLAIALQGGKMAVDSWIDGANPEWIRRQPDTVLVQQACKYQKNIRTLPHAQLVPTWWLWNKMCREEVWRRDGLRHLRGNLKFITDPFAAGDGKRIFPPKYRKVYGGPRSWDIKAAREAAVCVGVKNRKYNHGM
jgi:hypothetical protein